ncbi:hypothetical protein ARMGADRAFT_1031929 [Armillaria gallica]|uniref:Uncharacterized protein n=1 Tax=Armillaria gallica TaxID=47427 RepID=A0A2H3DAX8_ARMGA|nr:hypothetical protein ARMGADRAFT_1031929 [Armillaria gallica]
MTEFSRACLQGRLGLGIYRNGPINDAYLGRVSKEERWSKSSRRCSGLSCIENEIFAVIQTRFLCPCGYGAFHRRCLRVVQAQAGWYGFGAQHEYGFSNSFFSDPRDSSKPGFEHGVTTTFGDSAPNGFCFRFGATDLPLNERPRYAGSECISSVWSHSMVNELRRGEEKLPLLRPFAAFR